MCVITAVLRFILMIYHFVTFYTTNFTVILFGVIMLHSSYGISNTMFASNEECNIINSVTDYHEIETFPDFNNQFKRLIPVQFYGFFLTHSLVWESINCFPVLICLRLKTRLGFRGQPQFHSVFGCGSRRRT